MVINAGMMSSEKDDWETPQGLYDRLDSIYHFEIDAAADVFNAKAEIFFTKKYNNGLEQDWNRPTFCNPPYGREVKYWIQKGCLEAEKWGVPVVMLLAARTDTIAFHTYIMGRADFVYFIKGRIKFVGASGPAPFPSMVVVWDHEREYLMPEKPWFASMLPDGTIL